MKIGNNITVLRRTQRGFLVAAAVAAVCFAGEAARAELRTTPHAAVSDAAKPGAFAEDAPQQIEPWREWEVDLDRLFGPYQRWHQFSLTVEPKGTVNLPSSWFGAEQTGYAAVLVPPAMPRMPVPVPRVKVASMEYVGAQSGVDWLALGTFLVGFLTIAGALLLVVYGYRRLLSWSTRPHAPLMLRRAMQYCEGSLSRCDRSFYNFCLEYAPVGKAVLRLAAVGTSATLSLVIRECRRIRAFFSRDYLYALIAHFRRVRVQACGVVGTWWTSSWTWRLRMARMAASRAGSFVRRCLNMLARPITSFYDATWKRRVHWATESVRYAATWAVIIMILLPGGISSPLLAADGTWNQTSGGTYGWNTAGNWQDGLIPLGAGDNAVLNALDITGGQTINIDTTVLLSGLRIGDLLGAQGYELADGGGTLTFDNDGSLATLLKTGAGNDLISIDIGLNDGLSIANDGTGSLTLSGIIADGSGAHGLTVGGSGTVALSGANTFSGGVTLNGGLLALLDESALGGGTLTVNGGVLRLAGPAGSTVNYGNATTVNGTATILSDVDSAGPGSTYTFGALTLNNGAGLKIGGGSNVSSGTAGVTFGATALNGAATIGVVNPNAGNTLLTLGSVTDNGNTASIYGDGSVAQTGSWGGGAGGITYGGTGTLTLSQANTFTGVLRVAGGTVVGTADAKALGSGTGAAAITLAGGTLRLSNVSGSNIDFSADDAANTTVASHSTIVTDVNSAGAGNNYTLGDLVMSAPIGAPLGAQRLTVNGGDNVDGGVAGLTLGGVTFSATSVFNVNNPTNGGVTQLSLGAVTNGAFTASINGNGRVVQTGAWGNGAGGITYNGTGTLTLNQANTFTGSVTIAGGTVVATANEAAFGVSPGITAALAGVQMVGGTLRLTNPSGSNLNFTTGALTNVNIASNSTIISDVDAPSTAANSYTLGGLFIGAQQLNIVKGSNVSSGTADVTFGRTTLAVSGATFNVGAGANLTLNTLTTTAINFFKPVFPR